MLQTAGAHIGLWNVSGYSKVVKMCGIHLVPTPEPNIIRGKVQICDPYEIQHWGIVVELEGIITYSDRFKDVVKLFAPEADSPTVMRSTVYCQLAGKPEGLQIGDPSHQRFKKLRPHSHIFEFKLDLPTSKNLPAALTTQHVDVTYNIILYKRTPAGYEVMEEKPVKFHGYHALLPEDAGATNRPQHQISQKFPAGISLTLQTPKSSYLRYEFIPFSVSITLNEKLPGVGSISVFLLQRVITFEKSETSIVDTFVSKKPSNKKEFCIRGAFKEKREMPTYDCPDVHGLKLKYSIKCAIFNRDSEIIASCELDIVIGTTRIVPSIVDTEAEVAASAPPSRSRSMSLAPSMLSLFPPAYSNLSSRSGSITSLDTLPPHYDDLNVDHDDSLSEDQETAKA